MLSVIDNRKPMLSLGIPVVNTIIVKGLEEW